MSIYFIQAEQGGLIKIGYAQEPATRLYFLQNNCPVPLRILAVIWDGSLKDENELHGKFRSWRKYGEWFEPSEEILDFMKQNAEEYKLIEKTFDETEYIKIRGINHKRCKGFSITKGERCKVTASFGDYCQRHKP